jgi:alpha-1,2-mannosyltransferase
MSNRWSPRRLARILVLATLCGCAIAVLAAESLPPNSLARVDLQQDYVSARALLDGKDPYASLGSLFDAYLPQSSAHRVQHPNPHPPIAIVAAVLYSRLPYEIVSPLWTLVMALVLVFWVGRQIGLSPALSFALIAWPPALWVLGLGQTEILLLAICLLGWRSAGRNRDLVAGACLGFAAAYKLYPALLLIPFIARRRFTVILAAAAVVMVCQVLGFLVFGWEGTWHYWTSVLPSTIGSYTGSDLDGGIRAALARVLPSEIANVGWLLSALAGLLALAVLSPEMAPLALFLVLPSAWGYYAVLTLPGLRSLWRASDVKPLVVLGIFLASLVRPVFSLLGFDTTNLALLGLQPVGYALLIGLAWQSRGGSSEYPGRTQLHFWPGRERVHRIGNGPPDGRNTSTNTEAQ